MVRGVDCATPVTARAAEILKKEGFEFVGRYLVPPAYAKALTRQEAAILSAAGLKILCVWETTAARMKQGGIAGMEDGAAAFKRAFQLGMPFDSTIYFAADFEATPEDMPAIREYMQAASIDAQPYEAGIYGSFRVIEEMKHSGLRGFWQCVAWSGGKVSEAITVYQAQWQGTAECRALAAKVGFAVDINECPDMKKAGMWSYRGEPETEPETEEETDVEEKRYNSLAELPEWARTTVRKLIDRGFLKGNGTAKDREGLPADLDLSRDMVRLLVIHDRAGVYGT